MSAISSNVVADEPRRSRPHAGDKIDSLCMLQQVEASPARGIAARSNRPQRRCSRTRAWWYDWAKKSGSPLTVVLLVGAAIAKWSNSTSSTDSTRSLQYRIDSARANGQGPSLCLAELAAHRRLHARRRPGRGVAVPGQRDRGTGSNDGHDASMGETGSNDSAGSSRSGSDDKGSGVPNPDRQACRVCPQGEDAPIRGSLQLRAVLGIHPSHHQGLRGTGDAGLRRGKFIVWRHDSAFPGTYCAGRADVEPADNLHPPNDAQLRHDLRLHQNHLLRRDSNRLLVHSRRRDGQLRSAPGQGSSDGCGERCS